MIRRYFVRMDSASGETLAGDHFAASSPSEAEALARAAFSRRSSPEELAAMPASEASILSRMEARHAAAMAGGVRFRVRATR